MKKLFGTDGIRGKANAFPMTPEIALSVGRAVAGYFKNSDGSGQIIVGRDTRLSGSMIECAVVAGICSAGADATLAGVLPTPAVAVLTKESHAVAGIVISASHNPYFDNGIKIFNSQGFKLSEAVENEIEALVGDSAASTQVKPAADVGSVRNLDNAGEKYKRFLCDAVSGSLPLKGLGVVLDCANGATYAVAPALIQDLGADVHAYYTDPDGRNINENCGSEHPDRLAEKVVQHSADIGLAFDGDGDRLIAVDETGSVITGDQIIAVCARYMKSIGRLTNNRVVTTVMSNMGLGKALNDMGIDHIQSKVGDRHVMEAMMASNAILGGEDSGHMIFLDHHTTGDGILTALRLMEVILWEKQPLSSLKQVMSVYPQELLAVEVRQKPDLETVPAIDAVIREVEARLGDTGRVLVRYSGTQPVCRVMVEGPTMPETRQYSQMIAAAVEKEIGV